VTPHISEGEHLQLAYSVELSSFTGEGSGSVPPPRQTNSISSEVTVPNGHTVIVGGLSRRDHSETVARIPWLGELPLLEHLLSNRSRNDARTTLFVFLRPIILRDDAFEDLKYLSREELARAEVPDDLPTSEPMLLE